ncbi:hypothetical protein C8J57DRAFT_1310602, partial [Mycena rebaudengoi]
MDLPLTTTVLIVGAGPCGMAAALSLHHQGCRDILIVDSIAAGENSSRAFVIQAGTLEVLDTVGCAEPLVALGDKVQRLGILEGDSPLISMDLSLLSAYTRYPFGLVLPQSSTEAVLLKKLEDLGIMVLRPYKVVAMTSSGQREHTIDILFESGEVIQAEYVIGADGAKSVVRHQAGIPFDDPDGNKLQDDDYGAASHMVIGDVTFSSPPKLAPTSNPFGIISQGNLLGIIPFPRNTSPDSTTPMYRFVSGVPVEDGPPPHAPTSEYFQSLLNRFAPSSLSSDPAVNPHPIRIEKTYWSSRFRTHAAIAPRCFTRLGNQATSGVVLLISDAAHVHSPVGAQGMSLGIRDAISLGPALKTYMDSYTRGAPSDKSLSEWATRRHAQALGVIAVTKRALRLILLSQKPGYFQRLVFGCVRLLFRFKFIRRMAAWRISGLGDVD